MVLRRATFKCDTCLPWSVTASSLLPRSIPCWHCWCLLIGGSSWLGVEMAAWSWSLTKWTSRISSHNRACKRRLRMRITYLRVRATGQRAAVGKATSWTKRLRICRVCRARSPHSLVWAVPAVRGKRMPRTRGVEHHASSELPILNLTN